MDAEAEELLVRAWDDWVSLGEARYITSVHHPAVTGPGLREQTLALVELLMAEGLVDVGDVMPTFTSWGLDTASAVNRIRETWVDPDDRLLPGDVCWIAGTPAGRAAAQEILEARA